MEVGKLPWVTTNIFSKLFLWVCSCFTYVKVIKSFEFLQTTMYSVEILVKPSWWCSVIRSTGNLLHIWCLVLWLCPDWSSDSDTDWDWKRDPKSYYFYSLCAEYCSNILQSYLGPLQAVIMGLLCFRPKIGRWISRIVTKWHI